MAIYRVGSGVYAIQLFNYGSGASPNTAGGGFDTYFNSKPYSINSNQPLVTQVTPFDIELPFTEIVSESFVDDVFPYEYPFTEASSESFVLDLYFYEHLFSEAVSESSLLEATDFEHPTTVGATTSTVTDIFLLLCSQFDSQTSDISHLSGYRNMVRTSTGILHLIYGYRTIYHVFSTDNGLTWSSPSTISDFTLYAHASVAIDSNDHIHIVGGDLSGRLAYKKYTTSWQNTEFPETNIGYASPFIAVDSNNHIHVAWINNQIFYKKYTTSWQATEQVTFINSSYFSNLNMVIDLDNYIHIVCYRRYQSGGIWIQSLLHLKYTTSWDSQLVPGVNNYEVNSLALTITSDNNLHLAYTQTVSSQMVLVYRRCVYSDGIHTWENEFTVLVYNALDIPRVHIGSDLGTNSIYVVWEQQIGSNLWDVCCSQFTTEWLPVARVNQYRIHTLCDHYYPIVEGNHTSKPQRGFAFIGINLNQSSRLYYCRPQNLLWDGVEILTSWGEATSRVDLSERLTTTITSRSGVPGEPFNSEFLYSTGTSTSSTVQKLSTIPMNFIAISQGGSGFNWGADIFRSGDDVLHCVYTFNQSIFYRNSIDNGKTWGNAFDIDPQNYGKCTSPRIVVDANLNIHVVWQDTISNISRIRHRRYTTAWQPVETVTDGSLPSLAIDSNNHIHLVYIDSYWIRYKKHTTSWQTTVTIGNSVAEPYSFAAIAIDFNDYIHTVWTSYTTAYQLFYRKYTTSWQTTEQLTNESQRDQLFPSIAIDLNNHIHLVWVGAVSPSYIPQIQYRKYTTSWQAIEVLTSASTSQGVPKVSVDMENTVYVVWRSVTSTTISQRRYTTSWQAVETLITDLSSSLPIVASGVHSLFPRDTFLETHPAMAKVGCACLIGCQSASASNAIDLFYCPSNLQWEQKEKVTTIGVTESTLIEKYPYEKIETIGVSSSGVDELSSVIDADTVINSLSSLVDKQKFIEETLSTETSISSLGIVHYHVPEPNLIISSSYASYSSYGTNYECLDVVRAVDGTLHCIFLDANRYLMYVKSTDNGSTWTTPLDISDNIQSIEKAKMVIDFNDVIHIVYSRSYDKRHKVFNGIWRTLSTISSNNNSISWDIAIDSNNHLHFIYAISTQIFHRRYTTSWTNPEIIYSAPPEIYNIKSLAIEIASNDNIHVIWMVSTAAIYYCQAYYMKYTDSWQTPELLSDSVEGANSNLAAMDIAIDNSNNLHVVWTIRNTVGYSTITYMVYDTSWTVIGYPWYSWSANNLIGISVSVDLSGAAYILVSGNDYSAHYQTNFYYRRVSGVTTTVDIVTVFSSATLYSLVKFVSSRHPMLGGVSTSIPQTGFGAVIQFGVEGRIGYFPLENLKWANVERGTTTGFVVSNAIDLYLYEKLQTLVASGSSITDVSVSVEYLDTLVTSISTLFDSKEIYENLISTINSISSVSDVIPGLENVLSTINSISIVDDVRVYTENVQTAINSISGVEEYGPFYNELLTSTAVFISTIEEISHVIETVSSTLNALSNVTDQVAYLDNLLSTVTSVSSVIVSEPSTSFNILRPKLSGNRLYPKGYSGTIPSEDLQTVITSSSAVDETFTGNTEDLQTTIIGSSAVDETFNNVSEDIQTIATSISSVEDLLAYFEHLETVAQISSEAIDFQSYVDTLNTTAVSVSSISELLFYFEHVSSLVASVSSVTPLQTYLNLLLSNLSSSSSLVTIQHFITQHTTTIVSQSLLVDTQQYFNAVNTIITSGGNVTDIQKYIEFLQTIITSTSSIEDKIFALENSVTLIQSGSSIADTASFIDNLISYITSSSMIIDNLVFREILHSTIVSVCAIREAQTFVEVSNSVLQSDSSIEDKYKFFEAANTTILSISSIGDRQLFFNNVSILVKSQASLIEIGHYIVTVLDLIKSKSSIDIALLPTFLGRFVFGNIVKPQTFKNTPTKRVSISSIINNEFIVTAKGRGK